MRRRVRKIQDADLAAALRHGLEQGAFSVIDAIRVLRYLDGLSQEALARRTSVTRNVIKSVEAGLTNPTLSTLEKIAGTFGLRVAFVSGRQPMQLFDAEAWSTDRRRQREATSILPIAGTVRVSDRTQNDSVEPSKFGYALQSLA